jgi:serine protease DegQ
VLLNVPNLEAAPLARADTTPRIGQLALLTGRNWSGTQHARIMTISGVGGPLETADGTRLQQVISLPSSPYPGFSGSAVIDPAGGLLAVATAGLLRGRTLALPLAVVDPIVRAIEEHGGVTRGFLGVTSQPVRVPAAQRGSVDQEIGLIVLGVADESPAASAGVLVGDVVLRAGGAAVERPQDLLVRLGPAQVGKPLTLTVLRGRDVVDVSVTVGARPARW